MLVWVTFVSFILLLLALDLGAFHRRAHVVSVREGLAWSIVWTCCRSLSRVSCTARTSLTGSASA